MKPSEEAIRRAAQVPYGSLSTRIQAAYDVDFPESIRFKMPPKHEFILDGKVLFGPGTYYLVRVDEADPTPDVEWEPNAGFVEEVYGEAGARFHEEDLGQPHGEDSGLDLDGKAVGSP